LADQIVKAIGNQTAKVTRAIDTAHEEVALLREYRSRLIADVVTGKLDVREVARCLPPEAQGSQLVAKTEDPAEQASEEPSVAEGADA
jgi:type I restriction enzyme S subunit